MLAAVGILTWPAIWGRASAREATLNSPIGGEKQRETYSRHCEGISEGREKSQPGYKKSGGVDQPELHKAGEGRAEGE